MGRLSFAEGANVIAFHANSARDKSRLRLRRGMTSRRAARGSRRKLGDDGLVDVSPVLLDVVARVNFGELRNREVRRIPLLGTSVN
jgi:hypothetical protein